SNFGVDVNPATGQVTATVQPSTPPQFPNFNFLMTATQVVGGVSTSETTIRIHIHDSIKKIWLTPSSLTIHQFSPESRFTVLALFKDYTVGDITDWAQLIFTSSDPFTVDVRNVGDIINGEKEVIGGRLAARLGDFPNNPDITVSLKLASPPTDLSFTAKVFPKPDWEDVAKDKNTKVQWVAGPQVPNQNDLASSKPDSIKSVVESRANILFISDGFTAN